MSGELPIGDFFDADVVKSAEEFIANYKRATVAGLLISHDAHLVACCDMRGQKAATKDDSGNIITCINTSKEKRVTVVATCRAFVAAKVGDNSDFRFGVNAKVDVQGKAKLFQ